MNEAVLASTPRALNRWVASAVNQDVDVDGLRNAIPNAQLDLWDWGRAGIILLTAIAVSRVLKIVLKRALRRSRTDDFIGDLIGRILGYVIVAFGLVYALETLGVAIGPLLGALGILGIAIAFALQDILANFVAGIILQLRRPFGASDEIIANDIEGRVLSIDARTVTIQTPDGETVRIPSAEVIQHEIVNHTELGRRRTTLEVGVAYDTDLDVAHRVITDAMASVEAVLQTPAPEARVFQFGTSSIDFAARFWHEPSIASMWKVRHEVAVAIAKALDSADITIPFPQQTLHVPNAVQVVTLRSDQDGQEVPPPD